MSRIKEWVKQKKNKVKQSRTFLAILMLVIGATGTICYYEGMDLYRDYQQAMVWVAQYESRHGELGTVHIALAQEAEPAPEVKNEASGPDLNQVISKIQMLESSGGVNDDKCHRIGGHNSYGFGQGSGKNLCLESDEAVGKLVRSWFETELAKRPLNQAVCLYNTGLAQDTCKYLRDFQSL